MSGIRRPKTIGITNGDQKDGKNVKNKQGPKKMEDEKKEWTTPEITTLEIKETEQLLPPERDNDQEEPPIS